jgi:diguanylate cyclase (GGDEF)-like protein/PAS domain S-box-containing protein
MKRSIWNIIFILALGFALYFFSRANYLFFHLTVESITLVIGILILTISIISRNFSQSSLILTLGPGILVASIITFAHIATFKGMNIIPGYDANLPTQLWIVSNYILSVSIFLSILAGNKKISFTWNLIIFSGIGILGSILCFAELFPMCFVEGEGLTIFKKVSEYIIVLIYAACLIAIYNKKNVLDKQTYITMRIFLGLLIFGELMFTLYIDVYGIQNFLGHYFRLLAFLIIYTFIVKESIQRPFNSIFSELRDLSRQLELIIDNIPGLIFYKDMNNKFIKVNKYMADAKKISKSEMEGKSLEDIYPREDAIKYFEDDLTVIKSGEPKLNIEEKWENDGEVKWINTSKIPLKNNEDEIIGILGLSFDITERKQEEQRIKILQQAIEQSPAAIVITETDGKISYVNKAFQLITGYTYDESIGQNPSILKFNNEAKINYTELWNTVLSGKEWRGTFENKKKNGEIYWENAVISPIFGENGNIINLVGIKEDYTEKHRIEFELERIIRIDPMTNINNRRYFLELAESELARNKRYNNDSAFLMIDVDNFKQVNDRFGHNVGDEALRNITKVCIETIRTTDFMGRLGGEEFGVYLINTDFEEAVLVAERIRENISNIKMKSDDENEISLSVSIGITKPITVDEKLNEIMKRADDAMYMAKNLGRNKVVSM